MNSSQEGKFVSFFGGGGGMFEGTGCERPIVLGVASRSFVVLGGEVRQVMEIGLKEWVS